MKTSAEILEAHTTDDGTDVAAVIEEMTEGLARLGHAVTPSDVISLLQSHVSSSVMWLAGMVIGALDQMGAFEGEGAAQEAYDGAMLGLQLDWIQRNYDMAVHRNSASGLVIAQAVPKT